MSAKKFYDLFAIAGRRKYSIIAIFFWDFASKVFTVLNIEHKIRQGGAYCFEELRNKSSIKLKKYIVVVAKSTKEIRGKTQKRENFLFCH